MQSEQLFYLTIDDVIRSFFYVNTGTSGLLIVGVSRYSRCPLIGHFFRAAQGIRNAFIEITKGPIFHGSAIWRRGNASIGVAEATQR